MSEIEMVIMAMVRKNKERVCEEAKNRNSMNIPLIQSLAIEISALEKVLEYMDDKNKYKRIELINKYGDDLNVR